MMKRIFLFLLSIFMISSVFSQEEVWGYQSFGGEIGGGLVFKLDLENDTAKTVYRFGYSSGYMGLMMDSELIDGGNGLLYGTAAIKLNHYTYANTYKLFSYNPENGEINLLNTLPSDLEFAFADHENQVFYFWNENTLDSKIYKYELSNDTIYEIFSLSFDYGKVLSGKWTEIDDKYYFFTTYQGEFNRGTYLEFNPETDSITKIFDFNELKNPQGSILAHENGNYYGIAQRGGDNNQGSIFKLDPKGGGYEKLIEFNEELGTAPTNESIIASDGCIYGFTRVLGEFGKGSIYKYDPSINKLESVYFFHPQSDFMVGHIRSYRLKEIMNKLYFIMEPYETLEPKKGYLMCFDMETKEMNVSIDFHQTKYNKPIGVLTKLDNRYYCIALNDTVLEIGGVIKLTENLSAIDNSQQIIYNDNAENGQNPIWMCQGGDGDIYGITCYGGEENKGVLFSIDRNTEEFTKLMDMNDLGFDWALRNESFLLDNGNILGFIKFKENDSWGDLQAFELNSFTKEFNQIFIFPDSLKPHYKIKLNSQGNIYYANGYPEYSAFELDVNDYSLNTFEVFSETNIRNICEGESGVYYGMTSNNILRWNKNTNQIDSVFNVHYYGDEGVGSFIDDIYVSKAGMLNGSFTEHEYRPSWVVSFTYDLNVDTVARKSFLGEAFYTSSYKSYLELQNNHSLILGQFNGSSEIRILDQQNNSIEEISLEKSPFYIDFYWDWGGWEIDGGNAPFDVAPSIGLIKVQPIEQKSYWLGTQDSIWSNQNNWFKGKMPEDDVQTVISRYAKHFPYFDTLVEVADLYIEKEAKIKIASNGALSSVQLTNNGEIILFGDELDRGSLIFEELIEKGQLNYIYQSEKKTEKILALPVNEISYSSFDSLHIWKYQTNHWQQIQDTSAILDCHQTYKFAVDTAKPIQFSGDANTENTVFSFAESGLRAIPNPYAASLNWDALNLSNLSHKALYRFTEEDSSFVSYIDGLGSCAPLIQPLDVAWVYTEPNESVGLKNNDRIHAVEFEGSPFDTKNKLIIKATGEGGEDFTHIAFNSNTTASFDKEYDAFKIILSNIKRPAVFTYADTFKLSINQLPDTTMLDMAVLAGVNGSYTLSIDQNVGFDFVVLEDEILHTRTNLLEEDYSFDYFTSDGNYPFKLYFKDWVLQPLEESDVEIYYYPESIVVRSKKQVEVAEITFIDLAGRVAEQYVARNFFKFEQAVDLPSGHYVVQLRTSNLVVNKKILVRR